MTNSWTFGVIFITILKCVFQAHSIDISPPPTVEGSYRARGEAIEAVPEGNGVLLQIYFLENYDDEEQMASFTVLESGFNTTFIINYRTNQTFQYVNDITCELVTPEDWIRIDAPPSFLGHQIAEGRIRFSLQQLFSMEKEHLVDYIANDTFRNMPARCWIYEIKYLLNGSEVVTTTLYAYWSVPEWITTTGGDLDVPLGYEITQIIRNGSKITESAQYISILSFQHNAVNRRVFEPRPGLVCPQRNGTYKFPTLPKINAASLHSEYVLPDYQDVRSIGVYYDMKNYLLRVDFDRLDGQKPMYMKQGRKITREITSKQLGVTFVSTIFEGRMTCDIIPLKNYPFEAQNLINPKLEIEKWNVNYFFGVNTTEYVYVGKTTKRNIPCHVFQGIRNDWPEANANVTSVWEWCLAVPLSKKDEKVNFRDGEHPLINVFINITQSSNTQFPVGFRMIHHFYDVMSEDPDALSFTAFELPWCFQRMKLYLQFDVDITIDKENVITFENATSDSGFLSLWKKKIYEISEIPPFTLRVPQVESTIRNNVLHVLFTLLDVEPKLPDEVKKNMTSSDEARSMLQKAINAGNLMVIYVPAPGKQPLLLKAKANSLIDQVDPATFVEITSPAPTTTTMEPIQTITFPPVTGRSITPEVKTTTPGKGTSPDKTFPQEATTTPGEGTSPDKTFPQEETTTPGEETSPDKTFSQKETTTPQSEDTTLEHKTTGGDAKPTPSPLEGGADTVEGATTGAVASVTIIMLILGVAIGSSGTFYRLRGLPMWMRK